MTPTVNARRLVRLGTGFVRDPVKLTALLYLREALLQERYEDCAEFIAIATEFGAQATEVFRLLEDPRRQPEGVTRK